MRNLDFTSDSPQSIKLGDSSDSLSLRVTELGQPVDLSKVSSITVKIGNTLGFLTEIDVAVSSLLHPTDGRIDVGIDSKISSELPAGQYLLEVWIDDAQGNTAIYPDTSYPSVIGFSIKKNIMTATSTVVTTLTLADFETKFDDLQNDLQDKVTSGYFKGDPGDKGDKGDTGSVDNTGLISAPAFQSLQTQVDNSAVGTNLFKGSQLFTGQGKNMSSMHVNVTFEDYDSTTKMLHVVSDGTVSVSSGIYWAFPKLDNGMTWTFSADMKGSGLLRIMKRENSTTITGMNSTLTDSWVRYSNTGTLPDNSSGAWCIYFDTTNVKLDAYIKLIKIEKGSVATDWCPNPTEILTQSDYAKIQAAIVALGGALS